MAHSQRGPLRAGADGLRAGADGLRAGCGWAGGGVGELETSLFVWCFLFSVAISVAISVRIVPGHHTQTRKRPAIAICLDLSAGSR